MASRSNKKVSELKVIKTKSKKDIKSKPKNTKQNSDNKSTSRSNKSQEKITKSKSTLTKQKIIKKKSTTQTNESQKKDKKIVKDDKKEPSISIYLTNKTVAFSKTLGDNSEWFIETMTKIYNYYKIRKLGLITFRNTSSEFIKLIKHINNNNERNENELLQNTTKETIINVINKNFNINNLQRILHLINTLIALRIFNNVDYSSKITKEDIVTNYEPNAMNEKNDNKKHKTKLITPKCASDNIDNPGIELDNSSNYVDDISSNYANDKLNDAYDDDDDFSNIGTDNDKMNDTYKNNTSNDLDDDLDNDDDINIVFGGTNKVRDYFTEDEVKKIINEGEKDTKYNLILCLLLYNGFRIGGLVNIKMENIYDYQNNKLKYDGKTLERRNTHRYFSISRNEKLVNAFNDYFEAYPDVLENAGYLFPHKDTYNKPTSKSTIQKIIKIICKKCKIRSNLAHVHAFRKTVVVRLMKEENNLDKIATFIGHKSSATTFKHYWNPSGEDMFKDMNIPWIAKPKIGIQLSDIKKIDNHVKNVAKTETSETNVNEEYLQFVTKVYWPLKKDTSILEERFKIVKMLLSEKNKKVLDNKVRELENIIHDKYQKAEKENEWDKFTDTNVSDII